MCQAQCKAEAKGSAASLLRSAETEYAGLCCGTDQNQVPELALPHLDVREYGLESGKHGPHRALVDLIGLDPLDEHPSVVAGDRGRQDRIPG